MVILSNRKKSGGINYYGHTCKMWIMDLICIYLWYDVKL